MEARVIDLSEWEDALPSSGYEIFHQPAALSVLEDHSPGFDLKLYGGFKGQQVAGLLPLFVKRVPLGGRIISSPPPGKHVPHMGPLVMPTSPKQRKREQLNQRFTEGVLEDVGVNSRTFLYVLCSPAYGDPRPFEWADQAVEVSFTYDVPVGDRSAEAVLKTFSTSRRREIRNAEDLDVTIERGDRADAKAVYEQTKGRFSEQDEYFGLTWEFVRDLYDALGERARVYVARSPEGEYLTGIISLYSADAASFWLGGVRSDYDNVSMNSLLHWAILRDIVEDPALESVDRYDMVGAGSYRLSKYKSKFNPTLRRYYVVNSGGAKMQMAKRAYGAIERVRTRVPSVPSLF